MLQSLQINSNENWEFYHLKLYHHLTYISYHFTGTFRNMYILRYSHLVFIRILFIIFHGVLYMAYVTYTDFRINYFESKMESWMGVYSFVLKWIWQNGNFRHPIHLRKVEDDYYRQWYSSIEFLSSPSTGSDKVPPYDSFCTWRIKGNRECKYHLQAVQRSLMWQNSFISIKTVTAATVLKN